MASELNKTFHGRVHGRTIELDQDAGVPEGQEVQVQIMLVAPANLEKAAVRPSLDEVYAILGERFHSGCKDTAERHNEHQP